MKTIKLVFLLSFCLLVSQKINAQQTTTVTWDDNNGSVTVVGTKVFTYIPDLQKRKTDKKFYFCLADISGLTNNSNGVYGIYADIPSPSSPISSSIHNDKPTDFNGITVEVSYYKSEYNLDFKDDALIYGGFLDYNPDYEINSDVYFAKYWGLLPKIGTDKVKSIDTKEIALNRIRKASQKLVDEGDNNFLFNKKWNIFTQLETGLSEEEKYSVAIRITVTNATLYGINIPGVGVIEPTELFPPDVNIIVNPADGSSEKNYSFRADNDPNTNVINPIVEAKMGDQITFQVMSANDPSIDNLPATWLAATGREYYYHCNPSIIPGGLMPVIPFDVQSHYVSSNEFSKTNYPDWESINGTKTLTWQAQRRTDPTKLKYQAQYKFKKAAILGTKMQRKNKTEGQIMDFLNILKSGTTNFSSSYNSDIANNRKYYWNVDSDELLYFNNKNYDVIGTPGWNGYVKRVPLYKLTNQTIGDNPSVLTESQLYAGSLGAAPTSEMNDVKNFVGQLYEPWQLVKEGDYEWGSDGYPSSGFVINELVNAYWYTKQENNTYKGYEIEDFCLYKDKEGNCYSANGNNPAIVDDGVVYNGAGTGTNDNNKHPGIVTIVANSKTIKIPMKVDAPLDTDYGFYGNIITPKYSNVKSKQTIKVIGLPKNLLDAEKSKYSLKIRSYSLQDFPVATYKLNEDGTYDAQEGIWNIPITTDYNQGQSATLYYNEVIINGAEWKNTTIPYLFTKIEKNVDGTDTGEFLDLKSGYEDFVDNYVQQKRYAYDYSQGYVNNYDGKTYWPDYLRSYVFHNTDKPVKFSCMDALDNIWDMHGGAYYWGYRALAKQITDEVLAKNLVYVLTDLFTGEKTYHRGRDFVFTPSTLGVGDYEIQVYSKNEEASDSGSISASDIENSGDPSAKIKIKVVDFKKEMDAVSLPVRANIYTRELYEEERKILGLTGTPYDKYRMASINDVLATYMYVEGERAVQYDGTKNRFAKHNDFRDHFMWTNGIDGADLSNELTNISGQNIQNIITNYDLKEGWQSEWKDWLRHFSYGKFPKTYVEPNENQTNDTDAGFRTYVDSLFKNKEYKLDDFLRALIWLAPTDYEGYRINGLMKTIVDLPEFFNKYAFSGTAKPPKSDYLLPAFVFKQQDMTDANKYKEHLFRKLKNGGMLIYDSETVHNLTVYQTKVENDAVVKGTFMATTSSVKPIPLMVGQDLQTIQDYSSVMKNDSITKSFPIPAGVTSYLGLYGLRTNSDGAPDTSGCYTTLSDLYGGLGEDLVGNLVETYYNKGNGPINTRQLADTYPNSDLNIGLSIANVYTCSGILANIQDIYTPVSGGTNCKYDPEIDRLIEFCKSRKKQTIFLRIGYEFELVWNNGYQNPEVFKNAYNYIVNRMKQDASLTNVKYVWQASASPLNFVDYLNSKQPDGTYKLNNEIPLHDPSDFLAWYPGDDNVDIVAMSWFENPDVKGSVATSSAYGNFVKSQKELTDVLLTLAKSKNKPVMIAEATPRGYDIKNLTKSNTHNLWDGPVWNTWTPGDPDTTPPTLPSGTNGGKTNVSAEDVWANFYQPLFDYIDQNGDVIKYFHYINANWSDYSLQWQWTSENQYWGDARIQEDQTIKKLWQYEINKPKWIHGNDLHAPVLDDTPSEVTGCSVKLNWRRNEEPKIKYRSIQLFKNNNTPENPDWILINIDGKSKIIRTSPPLGDALVNQTITNLEPNKNYKVVLSSVDYFGKNVGQTEILFETGDCNSGRLMLNPESDTNEVLKQFVIFPNPTSGELSIHFGLEQNTNVRIELFDLSGRVLFNETKNREKGNQEIYFESLRKYTHSSGVVLLKVITDKETLIRKIMIH